MEKDKKGSKDSTKLRKRAEEELEKRNGDFKDLSTEDLQYLIQELQVHQIELEMQNEELMRTQQQLEKSRDKYFDLYDFAPIGYFTFDENGRVLEVNLTGAEMLGEVRKNLINQPFHYFIPRDYQDTFYLHRRQVFESKTNQLCEISLQRKDGSQFFAQLDSIAIQDDDGKFNRFRTAISDITEHKKAEEELNNALKESQKRQAEVSALLESSRVVLECHKFEDAARFIFDSCKNLVGATAGYVALLSEDRTENELQFLDSGELPCTVDPSLPMPIRGLRAEAYRTGKAVYENDFSNSEWIKYMPEGHARLNNVMFAPLKIKGKAVGLLGLANKPEGFNEHDARMASAFSELAAVALYNSWTLESLESSEKRFRSLVETANDAILIIQDRITYVNPKFVEISGFSSNEATGKSFFSLVSSKYRELLVDRYEKEISGEKVPETYEIELLTKFGGRIPVEINISRIEYDGKPAEMAIIRDITERKRLEQQLVESERKYRTLVENDPNMIFFIEGRVLTFVNQTFLDTLGFSKEELYAPTFDFFANIIPKQREMLRELLTEIYTGEDVPGSFELSLITKKGEIVPCLANMTSFEMEGKQVIQGVLTDIRVIEELQKELKESEMHYRGLYESSIDGIVSFDLQRNILECNQAFADMHGYTKEELSKMTLWDVIDKKWHFIAEKIRTEQILKRGYSDVFEAENIKKDGTVFPVSVRTWLIKDKEGHLDEFWGIIRDITERKRMEEELRKTQKRLDDAMQTGNLAWWDMDCSTGKVIFNEQKARMLGYTPEEFIDAHYTDFTDRVHPEDHERTLQAMREHLDDKKSKYEVEYRIRTKLGDWKWFYDVGGITERDKDGKPVRVTGVVVDITKRKQAEDALKMAAFDLRKRVKELRSLYGISQLVDKPGILLEEILQGVVELIPSSWQYPEITCARIILEDQEFKTENFRETIWKQKSDIIAHGNRIGALEVYYLKKMPESDEGPFQKEERKLINAIAERVGKIITRVQAEEKLKEYAENLEKMVEERTKALEESEERLKAILSGIGDLITIQNKDLEIIWANQAIKDIWGDIIGKKCHEVYKCLDEPCPQCTAEMVFSEGKTFVSEQTVIDPDGKPMNTLVTSSPVRDAEGKIVATVEVVKDITELKRDEDALQKSEARLAEAQRIAHLGNWDWNIQTNELHWSDEIYRIFGLAP
ncbi:MAG: PAS domain S-box protein, partial [Promethearchaeota archaeon]